MTEIYNMNEKPKGVTRYSTTSRKYVAFKALDHEIYRIKIRPKARAWERMHYSHLLRILENGYGTEIGLVFPFAIVEIKGRNLQSMGDVIDRHCCDFLQEFDESAWDKPSDPAEPFIETIDITVETREQIVRASDKILSEMANSQHK